MRNLFFAFAVATCVTAAPVVAAHADQQGKKIAYFGTAAGHPYMAGMNKAISCEGEVAGDGSHQLLLALRPGAPSPTSR